jgi:F-type H+-transporting ATPase subunit b
MFEVILSQAALAVEIGGEAHAEPAVAGVLTATVWVSLSMLVLIGIMVWKKVPTMIAGMLDGKIAQIRSQLDEASNLRKEAEALRGEYQAKIAALEGETAAMRARAEAEADELIARAKVDATALIARRQKMAEDRIAAAERQAVADVRATASRAAVAAAGSIIAEQHDASADRPLIDRAIADVGQL